MNASHVTGAGIGAVLGAILAAALDKYTGLTISTAEAALIGAAVAGLGVGVAHAVWNVGLGPIFRRIIHGPQSASPSPPPAPPPPVG